MKLFNLVGNGYFFILGAVEGKIEGEKDNPDNEGKENDGDTHIGIAENPADEPIEADKNIEERLVDIGDKESSHESKYTPLLRCGIVEVEVGGVYSMSWTPHIA